MLLKVSMSNIIHQIYLAINNAVINRLIVYLIRG